MNGVNIDTFVNYEKEYSRYVKKPQINGKSLTGLCPFHDDRNASFSVDLKSGKYTCFACGAQGNYINFVAETRGISTKEAYTAILEDYGMAKDEPESYTLEDYAKDKKLPAEWLKDNFHLESGKLRDGSGYIKIPYFDINGKQTLHRKRFPKGAAQRFKWGQGSAGKLMMYGEWRINEMLANKEVILAEGESDTQTLWFMRFPALGVPGASVYKAEWTKRLTGMDRLYIHVEPDNGGQVFLAKMTEKLKEGGFGGRVYKWSCGSYGAKDPSELYIKNGGEKAAEMIKAALKAAEEIDLDSFDPENAIVDAPVKLRMPDGWICTDNGISALAQSGDPVRVCRTPIIISRRLRSQETGEEKIEIAFKRDGKWQRASYPRSVIFQSRSITALADLGCTVTSENAKSIVKFLGALESENIDRIEAVESTSSFGWQTKNRFLPDHAEDMVLDVDPSLLGWAAAYRKNGSLTEWVRIMEPHRKRYVFRFMLAAGFAAPLLKIIRQRTFIVLNWGSSRGGKTAALKAALSAWGDPERLMVSFNATQVALERMAGFFCDLPLGIDERQLAGNRQESLEKIVYMIAAGTGRARGSKTGGLQTLKTWRTVALMTGEEPIAQAQSMTGVNTRIIELVGPPFDREADAQQMHQLSSLNCGWAGPAFISYILKAGESALMEEYNSMQTVIKKMAGDRNGSHVASITTVALADSVISRLFFGENEADSHKNALSMAKEVIKGIRQNELRDVNENAAEFITDWINTNRQCFDDDVKAQRYGFINDAKSMCYIFPSVLREALEKAGFSYRKTMKWLADEGMIETEARADGTIKYSVTKRLSGKVYRVISLNMESLLNDSNEQMEFSFDGFGLADENDEEMPF